LHGSNLMKIIQKIPMPFDFGVETWWKMKAALLLSTIELAFMGFIEVIFNLKLF
jgi:hypothetical protein